MTPSELKLHVLNAYRMVLGDKKNAILDDAEKVFDEHAKSNVLTKVRNKAIIAFMRNAPIESLVEPVGMLTMIQKYWHYRKAITSKLIPPPTDELESHLLASLLKIVMKHFDNAERDKFYDTLISILRFAEPHAIAEHWDEKKPLLELKDWVPLEDYLKTLTKDGCDGSESGQGGRGGDGVQPNEKQQKGKGKRKRASPNSAPGTH